MTSQRLGWFALTLLAGGIIGIGLVIAPLVVVGGIMIVGLTLAAIEWPEHMTRVAFFLVMVAGTKFRARDPTATLAGVVDLQIMFELVVYASILWVVMLAARSDRFVRSRLTSWELVLIAYVFLALSSTIWSASRPLTAVRSTQLLILVTLVLVAIRVLGTVGLLKASFGAAVVYTLVMTIVALLVPVRYGYGSERFGWLHAHPIAVGEYAALACLFVVVFGAVRFTREDRGHRYLAWAGTLVLVTILIATQSRGPILAFIAAVMALVLGGFGRSSLAKLVLPTLIAVAAAVALVVSPLELLELGEQSRNPIIAYLYRGQTAEQVVSLSGRVGLWESMQPIISERLLVGYGYQGARATLLEILPWAAHAHSALMETAVGLGIIGSVLIWPAIFSSLFPGRLGSRVAPVSLRQARLLVFGAALFFLLSSITTESFTGTHGHAIVLAFVCVVSAERLRYEVLH